MNIFVYGTLLKGLQREPALMKSKYLGPAMIQAELFDTGYFPGVKEGANTIVGELYKTDAETIDVLDRIEGYDEKNMRDSLFIRKLVKARLFANGRYVTSFCYFFNRAEVKNEIPHGDYRRYILEKETDKQWILAYGSNMSSARLVQRIGPPDALRKGYVEGFRLVFNKKAQKAQAAYANIAFSGDNVKCPGAAYRITSNQLNLLDQYEGVPDHYLRISLPFRAIDGNNTIVQAYIAHPDQLVEGQEPEPEYLEHIQKGYEEHGFELDNLI